MSFTVGEGRDVMIPGHLAIRTNLVGSVRVEVGSVVRVASEKLPYHARLDTLRTSGGERGRLRGGV